MNFLRGGAVRAMASTSELFFIVVIFINYIQYVTTIESPNPHPGAWYWLTNTMGDFERSSPARYRERDCSMWIDQKKYDDVFVIDLHILSNPQGLSLLSSSPPVMMELTMEVIEQAMLKMSTQRIKYLGETRLFKEFSPLERYQAYLRNNEYVRNIERQYNEQFQTITKTWNDSPKSAADNLKQANELGKLECMYSTFYKHKHFIKITIYESVNILVNKIVTPLNTVDFKAAIDEAVIYHDVGLAEQICDILSQEAAVSFDVAASEVNEGWTFKTVFSDCPLTEIDKKSKTKILNLLRKFGPIDLDSIFLDVEGKKLIVSFETIEGREKCIEKGSIAGLGKPAVYTALVQADHISSWSVFIEFLANDVKEEQVKDAFVRAGFREEVVSVKIWQNSAFVNCRDEAAMMKVAKVRRITIQGQRVNVVISRAKDRDETKAIVGFWKKRTPHLNALYKMLEKYPDRIITNRVSLIALVVGNSSTCNRPSGKTAAFVTTTLSNSPTLNSSKTQFFPHKGTVTISSAHSRSKGTLEEGWTFLPAESYRVKDPWTTSRQRRITPPMSMTCKLPLRLLPADRLSNRPKAKVTDTNDTFGYFRIVFAQLTLLRQEKTDVPWTRINYFVSGVINHNVLPHSNVIYNNILNTIRYIKVKEIKYKTKKNNKRARANKKNERSKKCNNVKTYIQYNHAIRILRGIIFLSLIDPVNGQKDIWEIIANKWTFLYLCLSFSMIQESIKYVKSSNSTHENIYKDVEKKGYLTLVTININGIANKMDDAKDFIHKQDADIVCIQETHIAEEENRYYSTEFKQWGYEAFYASKSMDTLKKEYRERKIKKIKRQENNQIIINNKIKLIKNKCKKAGGVITLIKCNLATLMFSEKSENCRSITTFNMEGNWALINIYAPTGNISENNAFYDNQVTKEIKNIKSKGISNYLIMGDFNATIDPIEDRWSNFSTNTNKRIFKGLENLVKNYKLKDTWRIMNKDEKGFTWNRVALSKRKKTVEISEIRMDLILTNEDNIENIISSIIPEKNIIDSDHKPVIVFVKNESPTIIPPPTFDRYEDKINTRNRNDKSKKILEEWMDIKKISNWIEDINGTEKGYKFDHLIDNINEYIYNGCILAYGLHDKKEPRKLNNANTGKLRREKRKICNLLNKLVYLIRTGEWDKNKVTRLAIKADYHIRIDENNIKETINKLRRMRKLKQNEITNINRHHRNERIKEATQRLIESQEKNPKVFYSKLNGKDKCEKTDIYQIKKEIEGKTYLITKPTEVVNEVGTFWQNLFTMKEEEKEKHTPWLEEIKKRKWNDMELNKNISEKEIMRVVKKLKKNKATGSDNIPNEFFIDCPKQFIVLFMTIYNKCFEEKFIPEKWKEGIICPIFKKGDKNDLGNFRPIALLQTQYKIYSSIINNRLTEQMYKLNMYSKYQGAWQKNKITINNAKVLVNMLEDSKKNGKEIHTLFIDICKAYDSVEHWGIEQICERYGLNQSFIEVIMSLLVYTNVKIITRYGYTKRIMVGKGVRQGDVISPTLFIIWLSPLLEYLENSKLGYVCENSKVELPILAFADDLLITEMSRTKLEALFKIVIEYCDYYHMDISPSKSGYMCQNNKEDVKPLLYKDREIRMVSKDKPYKYLGCDFNAQLDWEMQKDNLKESTIKHVKFLCSRRITTKQKVAVINLITYTKLTYRMQVVKFEKDWLREMDTIIANTLLNSAGFPITADKEMLWTKVKDGGWGLNKLSNLQNAVTINTNLTYGLNINGINKQLLLEKIENTEPEDLTKDTNDSLSSFLWTLNELGLEIKNKDKLVVPSNNIEIVNDDNIIKKKGITYVFTDGSLTRNRKAGAGVYFYEGCKANKAFNVPDCKSSLEAELHAIAYVTNLKCLRGNVKIVTDNEGAIAIISNFEKLSTTDQLRVKYRSVIRQICDDIKERNKRGWSTGFEHIFSHVTKKLAKKDKELTNRIEKRKIILGKRWYKFVNGNEEADKLAAIGRESKECITIKNEWRDDYVILKEGKIIEDNIYKMIINEYIEIEREKYHNKPKRGMGWRCDGTDMKKSVEVTKPFVKYNNHLYDFVFKCRQMTLQNKKRLVSYSKTNKEELQYMKEVYVNDICDLCKEETTDDRMHWRSCKFSTKEWEDMYAEIKEIVEIAGGTNVKLWFGRKETVDLEADKEELRITMFDKNLGDLFYIPKKTEKYLESCGVTEPEKTLNNINKKHIKRSYKIYKNRIKEQANILKIGETKKKFKENIKKEKRDKKKQEKEMKKKKKEKAPNTNDGNINNNIDNNIEINSNRNNGSDNNTNKRKEETNKNNANNNNKITNINYEGKTYNIKFTGTKKFYQASLNKDNHNIIKISISNTPIKRKINEGTNDNSNKRRKCNEFRPP